MIQMAGLQNGLGALVFLVDGKPQTLELHLWGDDGWDGYRTSMANRSRQRRADKCVTAENSGGHRSPARRARTPHAREGSRARLGQALPLRRLARPRVDLRSRGRRPAPQELDRALRWAQPAPARLAHRRAQARLGLGRAQDRGSPQGRTRACRHVSAKEREGVLLAPDPSAPAHVRGDYPEWLAPHLQRAFGPDAVAEAMAMAQPRAHRPSRQHAEVRSPKRPAARSKASRPGRCPNSGTASASRRPTPSNAAKPSRPSPPTPRAGSKCRTWAARSPLPPAAPAPGEQVLDYCAGGGGKTIAMAAMMENKGQIFAHDIDGRRLSALIPRMDRAGIRNVQLRHPKENASLDDLDVRNGPRDDRRPCTGVGTWRRKPDAKWRVTPNALEKRIAGSGDDPPHRLQLREARRPPRLRHVLLPRWKRTKIRSPASSPTATDFAAEDAAETAIRSGQLTDAGREARPQMPPPRRLRPPHAAHSRHRRLLHGRRCGEPVDAVVRRRGRAAARHRRAEARSPALAC